MRVRVRVEVRMKVRFRVRVRVWVLGKVATGIGRREIASCMVGNVRACLARALILTLNPSANP